MQTEQTITTKGNNVIYGTLNSSQKSSKLIIFSHGLTGNQNEAHYLNAPKFFNPKGFDTFRFNYYGPDKNARQIVDCSVSVHVEDLDKVYENFEKDYQEIYLIGHSLGAYVILKSNSKDNATKVILWDPSRGYENLEEKGVIYEPKIDKYIMNRGQQQLLNEQMIKEWGEASHIEENIKLLPKDAHIIFAGAYSIIDYWKPFLSEDQYSIVEGARHIFSEEGAIEELYRQTHKFLITN